jgi:hypothetical protein
MSHKFLFNASFHLLLNSIDQELAIETQKKGCPYCSNKLHQANYPRSPVGMLSHLRSYYDERISFCCDTCRKRTTPQSVRFFGRHWYPAPLLMLVCVLTLGINERRLQQVKRHFGIIVSESTWKRWRRWWRESFMETLFWWKEKGLVPSTIERNKAFPRALLNIFQGVLEEKMRYLLRFLAPLTHGVLRAV